jgi:hypothetical protein
LLNKEVSKFKELIIEATFLVRALFFFTIWLSKTSEIINTETLGWAAIIVPHTFVLRFIQLKSIQIPLSPLLFVAP